MEKLKAAVIGNPVKHSLSPKIHNYWLKQKKIEASYEAIEVKDINDFILNFEKKGLQGVNVTVPYKEKAYEILKGRAKISKIARKIGAINTIYIKDQEIYATNTDYYGFKKSLLLQEKGYEIEGKKILIIGAGGAAKSIIAGLSEEGAEKIYIINRNIERAKDVAKMSNKIEVHKWEEKEKYINFSDLIVNTTSCGLNGENDLNIDFSKIEKGKIIYDIVYKPLETKFLRDAKKNDFKVITGIGMLIFQAQPAFKLFFGKEAGEDISDLYRNLII